MKPIFMLAFSVMLSSVTAHELCFEHDAVPNCSGITKIALANAKRLAARGTPYKAVAGSRASVIRSYRNQCAKHTEVVKWLFEPDLEPTDCNEWAFGIFLDKCHSTGISYGKCSSLWDAAKVELNKAEEIKELFGY